MSPFRTGVVTTTERREFATLVFLFEYIEEAHLNKIKLEAMEYYKSSSGGVYKVYAIDPTTGKSTLVLNYKDTGMYNVINQQFSPGSPDYNMYIDSLTASTRSEFLALAGPAKTFLDSL